MEKKKAFSNQELALLIITIAGSIFVFFFCGAEGIGYGAGIAEALAIISTGLLGFHNYAFLIAFTIESLFNLKVSYSSQPSVPAIGTVLLIGCLIAWAIVLIYRYQKTKEGFFAKIHIKTLSMTGKVILYLVTLCFVIATAVVADLVPHSSQGVTWMKCAYVILPVFIAILELLMSMECYCFAFVYQIVSIIVYGAEISSLHGLTEAMGPMLLNWGITSVLLIIGCYKWSADVEEEKQLKAAKAQKAASGASETTEPDEDEEQDFDPNGPLDDDIPDKALYAEAQKSFGIYGEAGDTENGTEGNTQAGKDKE